MSHPVLEAMLGTMEPPRLQVPQRQPSQEALSEAEVDILPPLYTPGSKSNGIAKEKPIHRTIAYMLLKGTTQREVARVLNVHEMTISKLVNSGWFRELLPQIAHQCGSDDVEALLNGAGTKAAMVMIELLDSTDPRIKLNASDNIMNRVLGKPVTRIQTSKEQVPVDPRDELAQIDREIQQLQGKLQEKATL